MVNKIRIGEQEVAVSDLEPKDRAVLEIYHFTSMRLNELVSMEKVLKESKISSLKKLKTEKL